MTFDPMKFYEDGQRRQKRYDSLVPVFVVAIVLLVVFGAAFVAYQRSHVKPKRTVSTQKTLDWDDIGGRQHTHEYLPPCVSGDWKINGGGNIVHDANGAYCAHVSPILPKTMHDTEVTCSGDVSGSDEGCDTWRNQATVTQSSTTWYRCSDGVTVAGDLKNCPEYAGSGGTKNLDVGHEPFSKDEFAYSKKTPRKHERKPHEFISFTGVSGASNIEFYNPHAHLTLKQLGRFQQENPSPICILNIIGECWVTLDPDPKPDCLPGGSVKGDIPPCGEGTWYYRSHAPEISPEGGICDLGGCGYSDHPTVPGGTPIQYWTTGGTKPVPDCKMPADIDICPTQMLEHSKYIGDGDDDLVRKPVSMPRCDEKSKPSDECWEFLDPKAVDDKKAKP